MSGEGVLKKFQAIALQIESECREIRPENIKSLIATFDECEKKNLELDREINQLMAVKAQLKRRVEELKDNFAELESTEIAYYERCENELIEQNKTINSMMSSTFMNDLLVERQNAAEEIKRLDISLPKIETQLVEDALVAKIYQNSGLELEDVIGAKLSYDQVWDILDQVWAEP